MPKRIELKTSRTAEFTCMVRCLSYLESRPQYKSDDFISCIIMNLLIKSFIGFPFVRKRMIDGFPSGMYEYIIARTKYIDEAVKAALEDKTDQILILGADFDSRGIRFRRITREYSSLTPLRLEKRSRIQELHILRHGFGSPCYFA